MTAAPPNAAEHVDVLIVGAGLSGIGAAGHLQRECPDRSYLILESRGSLGGTWDLFRYPGVRSDSDMFTLGYSFRPWTHPKAIADGTSIRDYIRDTAAELGIDRRIRYRHRVERAEFSTDTARWTVTARRTDGTDRPGDTGERVTFTCSFLSVCSGYYRYDEGYRPEFPGEADFTGSIVHPQHWPADLDHTDKRVVVIGSGATAVTLVPALAPDAARVTMLQRSPSYVAALPSQDRIADLLRRVLPRKAGYVAARWKNVLFTMATYQLSRRRPALMKSLLAKGVAKQAPPGFDVATHFAPAYDPWDQRLCVVPDGDLFQSLRSGKAEVVTDQIVRFDADGIELASGKHLDADLIVSATGLNVLAIGGIDLVVDGIPVSLPDTLAYKGMMLSGVPNFSLTVGYTNASWTLKADLVARYVCRLLQHMRDTGADIVTPEAPDTGDRAALAPLIDLQAGYVLRAVAALPKQGPRAPWRLHQNYIKDLRLMRFGPVTDGVRFDRVSSSAGHAAPS